MKGIIFLSVFIGGLTLLLSFSRDKIAVPVIMAVHAEKLMPMHKPLIDTIRHCVDSLVDNAVSPIVDVIVDQALTQRKTDISLERLMTPQQRATARAIWFQDSIEMEKKFTVLRLRRH